jgi:hypothetical protein
MLETTVCTTTSKPSKQYRCSFCDISFDSAETLDSHQRFEYRDSGTEDKNDYDQIMQSEFNIKMRMLIKRYEPILKEYDDFPLADVYSILISK